MSLNKIAFLMGLAAPLLASTKSALAATAEAAVLSSSVVEPLSSHTETTTAHPAGVALAGFLVMAVGLMSQHRLQQDAMDKLEDPKQS